MSVRLRPALYALALSPLTAGCGGDLSNQIFMEDAEFLAALPSAESLSVAYVEGLESPTEGAALYALTIGELSRLEGYISITTDLTETARPLAPSERGVDHRVWGPGEWSDLYPGYFLRIEISRNPEATRYSYGFQAAPSTGGPWDREFFSGTHYVRDSLEQGDGELSWSLDILNEVVGGPGAGELRIAYDLREGLEIDTELDDYTEGSAPAVDSRWHFIRLADGGGDFEYSAETDLYGGEALEILDVRSRWLGDGSGRGDASLEGGDLGAVEALLSQCWGGDGGLVAQGGSHDFETVGALEDDCAWPDAAELEHL